MVHDLKKIVVVLNALKYNRGSEALVRGFADICRVSNQKYHLTLAATGIDEEIKNKFHMYDAFVDRVSYKKKMSFRGLSSFLLRKVGLSRIGNKIKYKDLITVAKKSDYIVVVGADNYDKSYHMFDFMHELNLVLASETNAKMIMYDCSLEKSHIDDEIINDFNLFDKITVRENITYNNLKDIIQKNKLWYYPDPAFVMKTKEIELPNDWIKGNMIGINVSDLITNDVYGAGGDIVKKSYENLIEFILERTEYNVVLVPHVMNGADLSVLTILYEKFKDSKRVILIDDERLDAQELKYIISQCRFYIGARTHSTIAAYSTGVPTLVLGYSVKSLGIAQDLFGTTEHYVVPVSQAKTGVELLEEFQWLMRHEVEVKKQLDNVLPQYIEKTMATSGIVSV